MLRKQFKLVGLLYTLTLSGAAWADLDTDLVAHWNFDDCTAKDITGSGYDGTLNGSIQCVNGQYSKALSFTDTGAVNIPTLPAILGKGFSGCAWASYKDNNNWGAIFDFGNGPYVDNIALIRNQTSNQLLYFYKDNVVVSGGKIINNHFQLYCATVDNVTHTAKLYINGKSVGKNTTHQITNIVRSSNFLGNNSWNEQFHGLLDDVRIWNRALSTKEVSQLYSDGTHLVGNLKGTHSYTVTCTNVTTNQIVTLPAQTTPNWDCSEAGLQLDPKQAYHISIDGIGD